MDTHSHPDPFAVTSLEALSALYGEVAERSNKKVTTALDDTARRFIAGSPFCILATTSSRGLRATPRGDAPGFVATLEDGTLALPDRRGNNRIEALRDIVETGGIALLFLVPGSNETLRINGTARLTTDPTLRAQLAYKGVEPATVILVTVAEVYMQCGRALLRSGIWAGREKPAGVPSAGEMIAAHTGGLVDPVEYDAELYARAMKSLY
ncbi:MSMEG_1061 family FMN-dependent PPOX-type flavoprotein [Plastoroseomonas arctica]|uniref:Flavin-nucleotide-binding protein n=1 Tax=Plastoroseomonas arctica TaxID=1509237 RepID=A0AAF1K5H8_9PROT|nr:MSMEG_1061 family FMN-dependent PPOX-type flavoprotein [Plastoroseomonas arctica]MBR0656570.1 flavin-nucleotide-binding protein [Plastoroseomonas arctica]